jgi:transcriptional regulator with XRE-family HTH domain
MTIRNKHGLQLNQRLRELRKERNFTQKELGATVGLPDTTIAGYEAKETADNHRYPQVHTIAKLAKVLGTTTDYLLGLTDVIEPPQSEYDVANIFESNRITVNGIQLDSDMCTYMAKTLKKAVEFQKANDEINEKNIAN